MRTDLKINYLALELISYKMSQYKAALEAIEDAVTDLKSFLEDQESEAVSTLVEKISDVTDLTTKKQDTIQAVKDTLDNYISDMRALVAEETAGAVTRVDTLDIKFNLDQIESSRNSFYYSVCYAVSSGFHPSIGTDAEAIAKQNRLIGNYNLLENFRTEKLVPLANWIQSKLDEMYGIYNNSLVPYETLDDDWRKKINAVYDQYTSKKDKAWNFIGEALTLMDAFLEPIAMAVLIILCPEIGIALLAIMLVAAVGCMVLADIPKEHVPDCLQGVRKKTIETEDAFFDECVKVIDRGPQVLLGDLGQHFMDTVQTPEGIASTAGNVVAIAITVGYTVKNANLKVGDTPVDDIAEREIAEEVNTAIESGSKTIDDVYDGVRQASEYLKQQGVPRQYRKQILESFDVRTIRLETAGENTYGLRFYGGNANAEGRYLFETFSPLTNRENLALPYEWNSMTGIQQFQVKSGTTMITGAAAPQSSFGTQYIGGAKQWYINNLEDMIKCQ